MVLLPITLLVWRSRLTDQPSELDRSREAITGGVPHQRALIDDFVQRVGTESVAELMEKLHQDEFVLKVASSWSQDDIPETLFARCLANRRLARLWESLDEHPEQRRTIPRQICETAFNRLSLAVESCLSAWEAGHSPAQPTPYDDHVQALAAGLFLMTDFDTPQATLAAMDRWREFGTQIETRLRALDLPDVLTQDDPSTAALRADLKRRGFRLGELLWDDLGRYVKPEPLFEINLSLRLAERFQLTEQPQFLLHSTLLETFSDRALRRVPLLPWNADTNPFDFTHIAAGVTIDDRRVLEQYWVIPAWGSPQAPAFKQFQVAHVRQQLKLKLAHRTQP